MRRRLVQLKPASAGNVLSTRGRSGVAMRRGEPLSSEPDLEEWILVPVAGRAFLTTSKTR